MSRVNLQPDIRSSCRWRPVCIVTGREAQERQERRPKGDCAVLACRGVNLCCSVLCYYIESLGLGGEVVFVVFPLTEGNILSKVL